MKRTLISLCILLFFLSSTVFAQLPFRLGIKGGLNIANLSFDPALPTGNDNKARTGFLGGAMVEFNIAPWFAIQVEPTYITKGCKLTTNNSSYEVNVKLNYLEIPVLLKLKIPSPGKINPYIIAGPSIGFRLSANTETPAGEFDVKNETQSTDFALDFGAGAGIYIAPFIDLVIDARYSLGLSNLLNNTGQEDFIGINNQKIKSAGFQISAGVMFGL